MKSLAAVSLIMAFVVAEPPSNSYLPPPRSSSYPQSSQNGIPQVVAARSQPGKLDHGGLGHGASNGFARSSLQTGGNGAFGVSHANSAQPRVNQGYEQKVHGYDKTQGYDQNAAALARNALEESNAEPANYNFGYMVNDHYEGTDFGHHEERQEERAQGEYHVVLPDGRKQTVSYEADERGFKPQISYEDTEDLSRSGYDSNANNFRSSNDFQGSEHGFHDERGFQGHERGYQGNERGYQGSERSYQANDGYKGEHDHKSKHGYSGDQNGARGQNGGYPSTRAGGY